MSASRPRSARRRGRAALGARRESQVRRGDVGHHLLLEPGRELVPPVRGVGRRDSLLGLSRDGAKTTREVVVDVGAEVAHPVVEGDQPTRGRIVEQIGLRLRLRELGHHGVHSCRVGRVTLGSHDLLDLAQRDLGLDDREVDASG